MPRPTRLSGHLIIALKMSGVKPEPMEIPSMIHTSWRTDSGRNSGACASASTATASMLPLSHGAGIWTA